MFGTTYKVGTGADTLYPASGGSEDWAKGKAHVKYSYLFELRPEEQVWDGFLLSENQVIQLISYKLYILRGLHPQHRLLCPSLMNVGSQII
ncbi:hypothetical protein OESDEN_13751 [Oesophagostomum dentatum]|uniref:Peptidase M14 domain-containing protein n=1 Tax=Oesophagostomum dentatum TaxID=61180 RepID=A0A0B1SRH5_OESDE|nr:hypothetical protein OESDEN_13751 [Oesophagostomum dentatum]